MVTPILGIMHRMVPPKFGRMGLSSKQVLVCRKLLITLFQIEYNLLVQRLDEGNMIKRPPELKQTPWSKGWHFIAFPNSNLSNNQYIGEEKKKKVNKL